MIDEPYLGQFGVESTSDRWYPVTPSDDDDLPVKGRAVTAAVGGSVVMAGADGVTATFTLADGQQLAAAPHRILATGTTATGIVVML